MAKKTEPKMLACPFCKEKLVKDGSYYVHMLEDGNNGCFLYNVAFAVDDKETIKAWNTRGAKNDKKN